MNFSRFFLQVAFLITALTVSLPSVASDVKRMAAVFPQAQVTLSAKAVGSLELRDFLAKPVKWAASQFRLDKFQNGYEYVLLVRDEETLGEIANMSVVIRPTPSGYGTVIETRHEMSNGFVNYMHSIATDVEGAISRVMADYGQYPVSFSYWCNQNPAECEYYKQIW